jgi:hypothetical protein
MGVGGRDPSGQTGLDPVEDLTGFGTTGNEGSPQARSARAFFQITNVEIKLSLHRGVGSDHSRLTKWLIFLALE